MRETKEFSALSWIPFQTHQDQENLWKSGPGELQCFVSTKATATADSSDGKPLWFISFVKFSSRTEAPQPNPDTGPPPAPSAPFKPPPEKLENVAPNPLSFSTSFKGKNGLYNWTYPTTTMPVIIIPVATGILGGGGTNIIYQSLSTTYLLQLLQPTQAPEFGRNQPTILRCGLILEGLKDVVRCLSQKTW